MSRCGCESVVGCQCFLDGGSGISVVGAGSLADPFALDAIIDPDTNNGLTLTAAGLLVPKGLQVVGFKELSVAGDTITINPISPVTRFLKIVIHLLSTGGTISAIVRFNNDSGTNYANRGNADGGADSTSVSDTSITAPSAAASNSHWGVVEVVNQAANEKIVIAHWVIAPPGAASVPNRYDRAAKWANTASQISRVDIINGGTGDFAIGSRVVVLGHD